MSRGSLGCAWRLCGDVKQERTVYLKEWPDTVRALTTQARFHYRIELAYGSWGATEVTFVAVSKDPSRLPPATPADLRNHQLTLANENDLKKLKQLGIEWCDLQIKVCNPDMPEVEDDQTNNAEIMPEAEDDQTNNSEIPEDGRTEDADRKLKWKAIIRGLPMMVMVALLAGVAVWLREPLQHREPFTAETANKNILCVGNPGSGKSCILNALVGKPVFASGPSLVKGLTADLQKYNHGGYCYMDTPGLADVVQAEIAAKKIKAAIMQTGFFKVVFVIELSSGRIRPDDVSTIKLVLNAIPIEHDEYGIIVNKLGDVVYGKLTSNATLFDELKATLQVTLPKKTRFVHLVAKTEQLDDKFDALLTEPGPLQSLQSFVNKVPEAWINATKVSDIKIADFEILVEDLTKKQEELLKNNTQLRELLVQHKEEEEDRARKQDAKYAALLNLTQTVEHELQKTKADLDATKKKDSESGIRVFFSKINPFTRLVRFFRSPTR